MRLAEVAGRVQTIEEPGALKCSPKKTTPRKGRNTRKAQNGSCCFGSFAFSCPGWIVGERLANIFLFEIRQFLDDLRWRHAVGHEVDDVRDRDAKAADGRPASQHVRVLRDSIEGIRHSRLLSSEQLVGVGQHGIEVVALARRNLAVPARRRISWRSCSAAS